MIYVLYCVWNSNSNINIGISSALAVAIALAPVSCSPHGFHDPKE